MTLRSPHGRAAELGSGPRVEVLPADELPHGVQDPAQATAGDERDDRGRFVAGARSAQAKGGKATKNRTRLAAQLGLEDLAVSEGWRAYLEAADDFQRTHLRYLSDEIGGGEIGPDVAAIVITAAWQLAGSRYLNAKAVQTDNASLLARASKLGNEARQNLLAARELAVRAAQSRRASRGPRPIVIPRKDPP